jgi:hypothetical protein
VYTYVKDGVKLARFGNYAHTVSITVQMTWEIARCKLCVQITNLVCVCVCLHV